MPQTDSHDEQYWLNAFCAGEDAALAYFFELHYRSLCYFAGRLLQDHLEAEDIVSDCFFKLWEKKQDFETATNIKAFLYISCRNACLNHLKKIKRKTAIQEKYFNQMEEDEETIDYEMIETEILTLLSKEIEILPEKCREVFKLLYIEGRKTDEIALQLGLSVQTVRNHKTRAVEILRTSFLKKGISATMMLAFLLFIDR
jgi:RNA polymerase sigma-70 factor (family 1)